MGGPSRQQLIDALSSVSSPLALKKNATKLELCKAITSVGLPLPNAQTYTIEELNCNTSRTTTGRDLVSRATNYNKLYPDQPIVNINSKTKVELCHELISRGQLSVTQQVSNAEPPWTPSSPIPKFTEMNQDSKALATTCSKTYNPSLNNYHKDELVQLVLDYNKTVPESQQIKNPSLYYKSQLCRKMVEKRIPVLKSQPSQHTFTNEPVVDQVPTWEPYSPSSGKKTPKRRRSKVSRKRVYN